MPSAHFDIQQLCDPAAYPWPVDDVVLIETHISWVLLAGDRVVKLKRPVDLGFVDFRDPARRKQACEDEVRLNQRLTTDVYLGVVPITAGGVDARGEPLEWATLMRRMPSERMLDRLIEQGGIPSDLDARLAERLIPLHAPPKALAGPYDGPCPSDPSTYLQVLTDNLKQVAEVGRGLLGPGQVGLVTASMRSFIETELDWLGSRFPGWLREGHGDLRCEHICLEPGVMQIYDCVEFEVDIRCSDIASDLAFLLMDLRRLGQPAVAAGLLERYRDAGFDLPSPVIDLYAAHRALVRAKVAAMARSSRDPERDLQFSFESAAYLDVATAYACPTEPMLVLVSGLSGSGKSTVAAAIGRAINGTVLSSDRVRKQLAGIEETAPAAAEWHQGIYADEWTTRTYDRLLELASAALDEQRSAVVDATFLDNQQRERFVAAARERGRVALIAWVTLDDAVARDRIERRARAGGSPSDATVAIRERQQAALKAVPVGIPAGALAVTIDTTPIGPVSLDPVFDLLTATGSIGKLSRDWTSDHA